MYLFFIYICGILYILFVYCVNICDVSVHLAHDVSSYNSNGKVIKIVFPIDCLASNDFKGNLHLAEIEPVLFNINPHGSLQLFPLSVNRSRSIIILIWAFYTNS